MPDVQQEKITGSVERIVYQNEENGYTVLELACSNMLVMAVGELPGVAEGEELTLTGSYTSHPTYGEQFKVALCERNLPTTAAAILKYLSSGAIKGIGQRTAKRIVERFGDDSLAVIEKEPERLAELPGLTPKKAEEIAEQYRRIFGIRSVMLALARYGVEPAVAIRVWKQWGPMATDMVEENPYRLCREGIGVPFERADQIAFGLKRDPTDPARLLAGLYHILSHNTRNGHTCLPRGKLLATASTLLEVEPYLLEDALEKAVENTDLMADSYDGEEFVYLPEYYESETYIAGRIMLLLGITPPDMGGFDREIDLMEKKLGIEYASLQRKAVNMALANTVFILTGGPGTGKTTTLNAILGVLENRGEKVVLAAPTGRAAKRMSEVTGREAKTIHRLLEVDYPDGSEKIRFKRHEKNLLRADAIILDEVSMVDTPLLHSLMKAMKLSCRLILVGDPDQLPSVGAGNILGDLIASDVIPTVHLSEIFRQAKESKIVESAHQIVKGEEPDLASRDSDFFFLTKPSYDAIAATVSDLCAARLPRAYGYSPLTDIQVIAPSRVGALGTVELNKHLQKRLNPQSEGKAEHKFGSTVLREGDKVMQIRNNYDIVWKRGDGEQGTGVFNGDIGVIARIDRPNKSMHIRFDDRDAEYSFETGGELEHAYAITVHKSQGSEFEAVVMPLMNYHPKLYYRNILYTAVTRAKKLMILLGKKETVAQMVMNDRKILRYTGLKGLLTEKS